MPCIRRRYNYGNIYLNPEPIGAKFTLAGQTVDVATKTDDFKRLRFAGFVDIAAVPADARQIKLINIVAFNSQASELGEWIEYGLHATMLGVYINGGVWLVLEQGAPIAWCTTTKRNTNVFQG